MKILRKKKIVINDIFTWYLWYLSLNLTTMKARIASGRSCVKIAILMYAPRLYPRVKLMLVAVKVLKQIGLNRVLVRK